MTISTLQTVSSLPAITLRPLLAIFGRVKQTAPGLIGDFNRYMDAAQRVHGDALTATTYQWRTP